jgi:hypothetical protein
MADDEAEAGGGSDSPNTGLVDVSEQRELSGGSVLPVQPTYKVF